jgi:Cu/Ag efflux protein CusF
MLVVMRRGIKIAFMALALSISTKLPAAVAQSGDYVNGQVTKIDEAAGKITIKHVISPR